MENEEATAVAAAAAMISPEDSLKCGGDFDRRFFSDGKVLVKS